MKVTGIPTGAVLVGVDGSADADHAADWAARHAENASRPLVLLHALGSMALNLAWMAQGGVDPTPYLADTEKFARTQLAATVDRIGATHPAASIETVLSHLDAREALLQGSATASVVVLGSRGLGPVTSLLLGSVSAAVARSAESIVTVVRPQNPGLVRRGVLAGIDGSAGALPVLEFAFRQAAELDLPLTVVRLPLDSVGVTYETAELALSEALAGFGETFPEVHVERHPETSDLLAQADRMNLVVLGRPRRGALRRAAAGSTAMSLLEHATTTVSIVPQ